MLVRVQPGAGKARKREPFRADARRIAELAPAEAPLSHTERVKREEPERYLEAVAAHMSDAEVDAYLVQFEEERRAALRERAAALRRAA